MSKIFIGSKKKFIPAFGRRERHKEYFLASYSTRDYRDKSFIFFTVYDIILSTTPMTVPNVYNKLYWCDVFRSVSRGKFA